MVAGPAATATGPVLQADTDATLGTRLRVRVVGPSVRPVLRLAPRVLAARPNGRGPTVLGPVAPHAALVVRVGAPTSAVEVGRVALALVPRRGPAIVPLPVVPVVGTARRPTLVVHDVVGVAGETTPAGRPTVAGLAGVLVATVNAADAGGAAAA